ncbi:probable ribonuclease ZC3H12C isoform X2 [Ptychodera flava]|uniref:probable ribonuclease ZC3H12C isoform X2 n=1 Tax=Ptychodera flava TaxID=63121 RepID=UPI00396A9CC7
MYVYSVPAKDYILSLCDPQYRREETYPAEYDSYLRRCRDTIEQNSQAVITFTDRHSVIISGDEFKVIIACSLFEEEIKNAQSGLCHDEDYTDSAAIFVEEAPRLSPAVKSSSKDLHDNDSDTYTHDGVTKYTDEQQSTCIDQTCADQKTKNNNYKFSGITQSDGLPGSTKTTDHNETLSKQIDFAAKLGYSESQVFQVLRQRGTDVDQNDLLHALVKMTKPEPDEKTMAQESNSQMFDIPEQMPAEQIIEDDSSNLRPIIIDGSNVAMSHGNKEVFSCRGIAIVVDWFIKRDHPDIKVFVPQWRKEASKPDTPITEQEILNELEKDRIIVWTPSRRINGRRVVCYDDRYIVKTAIDMDGIIVSNDNFRDLQNENPDWKKFIEERLLMYSFVNDTFMPPDDPLGRHGPSLENFLRKNPTAPEPQAPPCPYGKKCTYGNKCKYYHADRPQGQKSVSEKLQEQAKTRKEVRARGVQPRSTADVPTTTIPTSGGELKKNVSPQNSSNLGERRYANFSKAHQGMTSDVPRELRPDSGRLEQARYDPYSEQIQNPTYRPVPFIREPYPYPKAHTEPLQAYHRIPPTAQHYQHLPHTVELYRRDMYSNQPRYDPCDEMTTDMRKMKMGDHGGYHGGFPYNGQSAMPQYPRETYRHPPLSRQPSYHQPEMFPPQMHLHPDYHTESHSLHPNVTRLRSYPVEGAIPNICEPRPNMTRQNSTSDPQLYQDDVRLGSGRVYKADGEHNQWCGEQMYSGGKPPSRNGSEPILWPKPANQPVRLSSAQRIERPTNIGPPPTVNKDIPFQPNDPRYNIFHNLSSIFPREDIIEAMKNHPEEMDPQKICGYIINKKSL